MRASEEKTTGTLESLGSEFYNCTGHPHAGEFSSFWIMLLFACFVGPDQQHHNGSLFVRRIPPRIPNKLFTAPFNNARTVKFNFFSLPSIKILTTANEPSLKTETNKMDRNCLSRRDGLECSLSFESRLTQF